MPLTRYADPEAFLSAAAPLVAANAPMLAFLHAWCTGAANAQRCFMATWQDGGAGGMAMQRDDGPLVLDACAPEAAAAFAEALVEEYPALDGVTGPRGACEAFARSWQARTGAPYRERLHMRNQVLSELVAPAPTEGQMHVAAEADRDWLVAMLRAFADEVSMPISQRTLERQVDARLAEQAYRLWIVNGERAAFAGCSIAGPQASRIAPVYTLPALRGRGYASALVGAMCAELLAQRAQVFLITDVANATSNALYRRLGFRPLDDTFAFDLGRNA
jgi:predicted GNAT family acetyltransferase